MTEFEVPSGVHETESYWRDVVSRKMLSLNKVRVDKGVGRSRVHKGFKDRVWDQVRSEREYK